MGVEFHVSEVIEEISTAGGMQTLIRFSGYPSLFDMLYDISKAPYPGFKAAYSKFRRAQKVEPDLVAEKLLVGHEHVSSESSIFPMERAPIDSDVFENDGYDKEEHGDDPDFFENLLDLVIDSSDYNERHAIITVPSPPKLLSKVKDKKKDTKTFKGTKREWAASMTAEIGVDIIEAESSDSGQAKKKVDSEKFVPLSKRKAIRKAQFKRALEKEGVESSTLKTKGSIAALLFEHEENSSIYTCKLCFEPKKSKANLSNLITHLHLKHSDNWVALLEAHNSKNDAISFAKTLLSQGSKSGKKQANLKNWMVDGAMTKPAKTRLSLLIWAIKSQLPFHPFDSAEFSKFQDISGIPLDSAFLMKRAAATLRAAFQKRAEERLGSCTSISISADMWTSLSDAHYLVMTYHGVDPKSFTMVHHVLDLQVVYSSATGNVVSALIRNRIREHWGNAKQIVAFVCDSGANMLKCGKFLAYPVHKCFAHALKGVVDAVCGKEATKKTANLYDEETAKDLNSVKVIAQFLDMTAWMAKEVLGEKDEANSLTLILENVTRWEAKYLALQRFLRLKDKLKECKNLRKYFKDVDKRSDVADDILSKSFFKRLESHLELLKVFHEISVLSQYENQCSIAWIPSWIWKIQDACTSSGSSFGKKLKEAVEVRLVPKYLAAGSIALKGALLNPFLIAKTDKKLKKEIVEATWKAIVEDAAAANTIEDRNHEMPSDEQKERTAVLLATLPLLLRYMKSWLKEVEEKDNRDSVIRDAMLFSFWRDCPANQPTVAPFLPVASRYLGIPATSASSERAFSSTGNMVTKLRNRMSSDLLEDLLLCRDWILQPCYSFADTVNCVEEMTKVKGQPEENLGAHSDKTASTLNGLVERL